MLVNTIITWQKTIPDANWSYNPHGLIKISQKKIAEVLCYILSIVHIAGGVVMVWGVNSWHAWPP